LTIYLLETPVLTEKNMKNKINKEWRHSINATPIRPRTAASDKEPRRTLNKNRTGHKAEPYNKDDEDGNIWCMST
jgi:hypothetical protein